MGGRQVVQNYLLDEPASDSEDETAINKVRKEALATVRKGKSGMNEQFRNALPPSKIYKKIKK